MIVKFIDDWRRWRKGEEHDLPTAVALEIIGRNKAVNPNLETRDTTSAFRKKAVTGNLNK
jgi:hypothetical protein